MDITYHARKSFMHVGQCIYGNRENAPKLLRNCYSKCIELAENYRKENGIETLTIGFPCISTGVFGYPKDEACKIAIDTIREYSNSNIEIKLVCFDE